MNLIEPDEAMISPIAARYAKRFRMVDREDIKQELRLWWLAKQKTVRRYVEDGEERKLAKSLQRHADRFCREQKAATLGYHASDEFFYNTGIIRDLLPMVWDPELITQDQRPDESSSGKRTKPANEGNNLLAMVADVARAVSQVSAIHHSVLLCHFAGNTDYDDLAIAFGLPTVAAAKMRVQRAVQAVVDELGGVDPNDGHGGPGSRRAITNAHSQAITRGQYE